MKPVSRHTARMALVMISALLLGAPVQAGPPSEENRSGLYRRCVEDLLNADMARKRNIWAYRCGFISAAFLNYADSDQIYVTFTHFVAPVDPDAPCVPGPQEITGHCKAAGCYTPGQRVLFSRQWRPVNRAYEEGQQSVTAACEPDGSAESPFCEVPIQAFVTGNEQGEIFTIAVAGGHAVDVTPNHPLIDMAGVIIRADAVVAGETYLATLAGPQQVVSVSTRRYDGPVWNVEPADRTVAGNVLFAEGFLTGSVRYQNEWAEESFRLHVRDQVDLDRLFGQANVSRTTIGEPAIATQAAK